MRALSLFFVVLLALPVFSGSASAQRAFTTPGFKYYTVRANRRTAVSYHAQTNGSCYHSYRTSVVVTHPPRHGDLRLVRTRMKLPWRHPEGRCRGKVVWVIKVYYIPNRGYRGRDAFGYQLVGLSNDIRIGPRHFGLTVR